MNSKSIIILIATISMMGCTTMRPIDARKADLTEQVSVGDYVLIYEKSGFSVDMTITSIDSDTIQGTLGKDSEALVQVNVENIETIEKERIAVAKTAGAILGGIVVGAVWALGAGLEGAAY